MILLISKTSSHISLSNEPEASNAPVGLNRAEWTSPCREKQEVLTVNNQNNT